MADAWAVTAVDDPPDDEFSGDQADSHINEIAPGAKITSRGRTPEHNAEVGGVPTSMHLEDQARDIVLPKGMTAGQFRSELTKRKLPVTEFLDETDHVHWDWGEKAAKGDDSWAPTSIDGAPVSKRADQWAVTAVDGGDQGQLMPGKVFLNPKIAPKVPEGAPRPFAPGEYVQNPDGTWSSEISVTVRDKDFNHGRATNIPSLWLVDGKPRKVSESQAIEYAKQSGISWPSFRSIKLANDAAMSRENAWQTLEPKDAGTVAPLWQAPNDGHWHDTKQENDDLDHFLEVSKQTEEAHPGWWDTVKNAVTTLPDTWKMMVGGAMRYAAEHPGILTASPDTLGGAEQSQMLEIEKAGAPQLAKEGARMYRDALADLKANSPGIDDGLAKRIVFNGVQGTLNILPLLAATVVTKSPVVPIAGGAAIGVQIGAEKYGGARQEGRTANQASMDAAFSGIVNGALGALPLGVAMKSGQKFLGRFLRSAGSFAAISTLTEALQSGYDMGMVNPEMTVKEAASRVLEAGLVGLFQGAILGGGHGAVEAVHAKMAAHRAKWPKATVLPPERQEPTADAGPRRPEGPEGPDDGDGQTIEGTYREAGREPPPPTPEPEPGVGPVQADVRKTLGLARPGRPPVVDQNAPPLRPIPPKRDLPVDDSAAAHPDVVNPEKEGIPRRDIETDTAVTSSGREVPVQYAIVEAGHLVTSQTAEGNPNPNFPAHLQPRDRTRAVSQAQVAAIANNINPKLLDKSPNASDGAPIVAPSGVVESGNGRTMAIQRAYQEGLPSAAAYKRYLEEQGYPVQDMQHPVLVRVRTGSLEREDRQAFVREANQSGQLGYSATERALSDAAALPDHALDLYRGGDVEAAANREFVRAFMGHAVAANEHAGMVGKDGALSQEAIRRVRGALLAKAYADPELVASVVESQDSSVKAIGGAMTDAAADWAKMRSAANRGEIPPEMDQTPHLLEAVKLVARARQDGRNVAEFVNQNDIFTGQALHRRTEAWLRMLFRNTDNWTSPVGRDKLADGIKFFATEAQKAQVGENLLGEPPVSPDDVLKLAKAKQYGQEPSEPRAGLSFGQDVRAYGGERDQSAVPGSEAPGGAGAAQDRAQPPSVRGRFGPRPARVDLAPQRAGDILNLTDELGRFMAESGITPRSAEPQKLAALAEYIYRRGVGTGFEQFGIMGTGGFMVARSDGRHNSVSFNPEIKAKMMDPASQLVSVHNHPSSKGPSGSDLASTAYPGQRQMVVVTKNGDYHAARLNEKLWTTDIERANRTAHILRDAYERIGAMVERHVRPIYERKHLTADQADELHTYIQNRAMELAGFVHYMTDWQVPAGAGDLRNIITEAAHAVREKVKQWSPTTFGNLGTVRAAEYFDRHPGAVHFQAGLARIFGQPEGPAGLPGSPGGEGHGRAPTASRKPEQLKLLEDENRYEATRPPFYSQLTRSVEDLKLTRAPAKDWLGAIENLKGKGVKQEEIEWSGIKDWLAGRTGPVTKADVIAHLKENEVQVQEVAHGGPTRDELVPDAQAEEKYKPRWDEIVSQIHAKEEQAKSGRGPVSPADLNREADRLRDSLDKIHSSMIQETWQRQKAAGRASDKPGKYKSYALPGGENYRELLLTLPTGKPKMPMGPELPEGYEITRHQDGWAVFGPEGEIAWAPTRGGALTNAQPALTRLGHTQDTYRSQHWDEPNVLAHVRFDDRTGPDGEKILHVAEIQSDWHQKGRKSGYLAEKQPTIPYVETDQLKMVEGEHNWTATTPDGRFTASVGKGVVSDEYHARAYLADYINKDKIRPTNVENLKRANQGVPNAPFKSSWHELAAKRMLRYAAEHGYDRLSWDTGETNSERYDLSKQVDHLLYKKNPDGTYRISAQSQGRGHLLGEKITEAELENHVGKDVAKRIVDGAGRDENLGGVGSFTQPKDIWRKLSGLDLKVGGEGMRGFYDKILPASVAKIVKKWGGKVEKTAIPANQKALFYEGPTPTKAQIQAVSDAIHARPTDQRFISPVTGKRLEYQINRVSNESAFRDVVKEMERGKSFADAMETHGNHDLAYIFGGDMVEGENPSGASVHSVKITPAMRESVMQGQALFEDSNRYKTEPGALDGRGKAVDQTIMPGAEPSAQQLAKAREAQGGGRLVTKVQQKAPGGLFGDEGAPDKDQLSLFEDENRYNDIPGEDRAVMEKAARTGDWIGKFKAKGADAEARIRDAISRAFQAWKRNPHSVPLKVRQVFSELRGAGPHVAIPGVSDVPTARPTAQFKEKLRAAADAVMDLVHDTQMLLTPMALGTNQARATAKHFANMMRLARWHGNRMMTSLKDNFTPSQLRKMWEAADEESVLRQKGEDTAGRGLATLSSQERQAVLEQQADADAVWQAAKDQGMVEGDGLPSYVPRMMVEMAGGEFTRLGATGDTGRDIPGMGRNVRTSTPQMKQRKHMTTEETEAAGTKKFGTMAQVVRDIRTLPLATMRLREAVAGRALINKIKEIGQKTGEDTVVEGSEPAGSPYKWFTINNPAFKTWRIKLIKNEETGKHEPQVDQNGDPVFEKVPIYVRSDFEGPLRAVLTGDNSKVYNAVMDLKGRAMSAIMYSPLIHNMVEWGRALPAMPGKVFFGKIYFEGNRAKRDPEIMSEAIMAGLVPIGHQAGFQDITSIANPESIKAGRSITAKILGFIPGLFNRDAKEAVYRAVDAMGDIWHNKLLWDRVGDLQMGLYVNFRANLIKKGNPPQAAAAAAAHFANRYAGALPMEAMSGMARKIANILMFSRSYTLGNLGALKDVVTGLPRDVQAQIEQQGAPLKGIRSMAARKALSILLIDIALFYASNSILQSALAMLAGRDDLGETGKGYVDRAYKLSTKIKESPLELLNVFGDLQALSATSENEPGRENRILVGYDRNGTAIYARNPTGKIGEEFVNWFTKPLDTIKAKLSTFAKPTYQVITNDAGFGRHVYDPEAKGLVGLAKNLGAVVWLYFKSQVPVDTLDSARRVMQGKDEPIDKFKVLGPLAGVTFSKGAPGGPAVGELFGIKREQEAKIAAAMPDIIEKIKSGDEKGARADMRALKMAPGLQNYYIRVTKNPKSRLRSRRNQALIRNATPEQKARFRAAKENSQ